MRKVIIIFFILLGAFCFAQENVIWGVWNVGEIQCPEIVFDHNLGNDGIFLNTRGSNTLIFRSDYYGNGPRISEQGYNYRIKEIIFNKDKLVLLYIETTLQSLRNRPLVNAKIVLHFIDENRMWIDVDRSDEKYPTDPRFSGYPFNQGSAVVFWRERVE
jgi:hypothetical protein